MLSTETSHGTMNKHMAMKGHWKLRNSIRFCCSHCCPHRGFSKLSQVLSTRLRKIPDWLNGTTIRCLGVCTNGTSPLNQQSWKLSTWKSRGEGNEERQKCDDLHHGKFAENRLYRILNLGRSYSGPRGIVVESIEESKLRVSQ